MDAEGRLSPRDAQAIRRAHRRAKTLGNGRSAEPETILGKFDSLPPAARAAIVDAIERDDRWRLAAFDLGGAHAFLVRTVRRAKWLSRWRPTRVLLDVLVYALQAGPAFAVHSLYRRVLAARARLLRRPRLDEMFAAEALETRRLTVCYARGVPQLPGYRGFWHDADDHKTVGLIVGIDLIENAEGFWFVESNMDCDLARRAAMYDGKLDPLVRRLLDFAEAGRYRRLIVLPSNTSVDPDMAVQYKEEGLKRDLSVAIVEDAFRPRFGHPRSICVPLPDEPLTLLVRNRYLRTSVDYLVQNKRASSRALRIFKDHTGDSSFELPPTSDEPRIGVPNPSEPFPNVVFKFPERDNGTGVFFIKASSASHAKAVLAETLRRAGPRDPVSRLYSRFEDRDGIFQQYIPTPLRSDRRLHRTRAYILLTPVGVEYLCAHRLVCAQPVPLELPVGIVRDQRPYLVSSRPGRLLEVLAPEDERAVRQAALGVARGLAWAIEYGFQTGSRPRETVEATNLREQASPELSNGTV